MVGFIQRKLSEEPGRAAVDFAISTYFAAPAGCLAVQVGAPNTHQVFLLCKQRWKILPLGEARTEDAGCVSTRGSGLLAVSPARGGTRMLELL